MRVLMMAGLYALGGASIVIENLADHLCKRGVEVTIGALTFKRIPPNGAYNVRTLPVYNALKLKRFLDDFDVVHSHHALTNYLALISRKPFVYHYHGAPSFGRGNLFRFSMLLSVKLMNHAFDAVITVSESGATELKRYFSLNNVHVIYNGVNTNHFKKGYEERFRKGTPQFLFVGNLYEHKRVDEIIFALKKMIMLYPKACLQIVGEGNSFESLKNLVAKLKMQDHVTLTGYVPPYELPHYYSSCDVYVTSSRCEQFPLPLIEAWACGKPVVASSIPAHTELLLKSRAGRLYETGNIKDLCAMMTAVYEQKDKLQSNALHFAKENNWSVVADRILRIYAQIIKN